jgi:hypothetical protein
MEKLMEPLLISDSSLPHRRESSNVKSFWIPAFAGMTFLEVALNMFKVFFLKVLNPERFNKIWKIAKKVSDLHFCIGPIP